MAPKIETRISLKDEFTKTAQQVQKSSQQMSSQMTSGMKGLAAQIGATVASYFALQNAIQAVSNLTRDSLAAHKTQQEALIRLDSALRATGGAAGITGAEMRKMATELGVVTTFGDEVTHAAQALMVTFTKIGKNVFPEAIKRAQDMSVMFGQDLNSAAKQLGTALNDPIQGVSRLQEIGISFSGTQKEQIKNFMASNDVMSAQKVILDELNAKFGGVAEAMAEYGVGSLELANNRLGDAKELIGEGLLPFTTSWVNQLATAAEWVGNIVEKFNYTVEEQRADLEEDIKLLEEKIQKIEELGTVSEEYAEATRMFAGEESQMYTTEQVEQMRKELVMLKHVLSELPGGDPAPAPSKPSGGGGGGENETAKKLSRITLMSDLQVQYIKETAEEAAQIRKEFLQSGMNEEQKALDDLRRRYEERREIIAGNVDAERELLLTYLSEREAVEQEFAEARREREQEDHDRKLEQWQEEQEAFSQMQSQLQSEVMSFASFTVSQERRELREKTRKRIQDVKSLDKSEEEKEKIIEKIKQEAERKEKEYAEKQRTIAYGKAGLSYAIGVGKELEKGVVAAAPFIALQTALFGLNMARISQQKFAKGGIVEGPTSGDQVPIMANGREGVFTVAQQKTLFDIANGRTSAGGSSPTINLGGIVINGNPEETDYRTVSDNLVRTVETALEELEYRGRL